MKPYLWSRTTISGIRALDDPAGHSQIVSMLDPEWPEPDMFETWEPKDRIVLRFHDEIAERENRVMPDEKLIASLLTFGEEFRDGDPAKRLFIHCQSGMSRSTAGAMILWAQAHPEVSSKKLFSALREVRPVSWPNTLMLRLADAQLGRSDRMADAAPAYFASRLLEDEELKARMIKLRRTDDIAAMIAAGLHPAPDRDG
tara:strand:- start:8109 stop:8708 length:600 start_codon:yes stop_codon:yes gene_type:complete